MRISDWSSDVCSSDLGASTDGLAAIAAIGTVADLAPMTGESRAIVRLGLDELARTDHAGLRALLRRSCERPGQPTARSLGFGDRKSVVAGKGVSVRVYLGGARTIKKKTQQSKS